MLLTVCSGSCSELSCIALAEEICLRILIALFYVISNRLRQFVVLLLCFLGKCYCVCCNLIDDCEHVGNIFFLFIGIDF